MHLQANNSVSQEQDILKALNLGPPLLYCYVFYLILMQTNIMQPIMKMVKIVHKSPKKCFIIDN